MINRVSSNSGQGYQVNRQTQNNSFSSNPGIDTRDTFTSSVGSSNKNIVKTYGAILGPNKEVIKTHGAVFGPGKGVIKTNRAILGPNNEVIKTYGAIER